MAMLFTMNTTKFKSETAFYIAVITALIKANSLTSNKKLHFKKTLFFVSLCGVSLVTVDAENASSGDGSASIGNNANVTLDTGDDVEALPELDSEQQRVDNSNGGDSSDISETKPALKWQVSSRAGGGGTIITANSGIINAAATSGWSAWSKWSTCSRTCDGGVSRQLRRCNSYAGCHGEPVRYKICNMQPCPNSRDFRAHQCAAYNDVPYEGALLRWTPHYEDSDPCALTCRGRPAAEPRRTAIGVSSSSSASDELLDADDDALIVVKLADKVQDGTRCRPGSLDMCISGKCQRVGCDLRIGSTKKVDACGVCGGDGTSCAQPLYHWEEAAFSLCSVTCGGGYKMSRPVCRNRMSGGDVDEQLCDASRRPEPRVAPCNQHRCPARWQVGEWGHCSLTCGGGSRLRTVQCMEIENNTKIKVPEHTCRGRKPHYQEACNQIDCPKWHPAPWSGCSVSCGEGVQVRIVECRDASDNPSTQCDPRERPAGTQPCSTGIACPSRGSNLDDLEDLLPPSPFHTPPLIQPYPPPLPAKAEKLVGEEVVPSEATFMPGEWGPCSCTEGIRMRDVDCKIFLEFSKTLAKLPDEKCLGPKPASVERCPADRCYGDYPVRVAGSPGPYSWKEAGYADCSASCLGGTQEMIIVCINESNQKPASHYMCDPKTKPEVKIRTCNDQPCPPRWNYSDFAPCTKSCGMGIQTREVNCIHEITNGASNTAVVPNMMCPQPPPPDRQYCNVLDCPIKWEVSDWSKCSKSCGTGEKVRKVECKQVMAQNHVVQRPDHLCSKNRPSSVKPCNTKSCVLESDKPHIATTNTTYIQHDASRKKFTAKVGGSVTLFYGITLKIKCPVKRFDRSKIKWSKDQNNISKSKKYKISKKGALRIQNLAYRDSGIYTCIAGKSSADLTVSVKPRPGEFPSSEEIDHANRIDDSGLEASDVAGRNEAEHQKYFKFEYQSHEDKGDGSNYKKMMRHKTTTVRPASPKPSIRRPTIHESEAEMNRLDAITTQIDNQKQEDSVESHKPDLSVASQPSSGTRPMPHFQQLLSNLQTFTNSRGHRMVGNPIADDGNLFGESLHQASTESDTDGTDYDDDSDSGGGEMVILGKGSAENLKFDWMITDWSECTQSCGIDGFQMRAAQCMVRLNNKTKDVDDNLCEDAGLKKPPTIQKCGGEECPTWKVSEWTPCEKSRCFTWNTAMQRRDVNCVISNNTEVRIALCSEQDRPPQRQECYNDKCKGVWRVGEWSECAASCEAQGIKYRILQCVWYGTKRAAGNACREQPRPAVMKMCKGPPCPANMLDCKDQSKFCKNVKAMNMCRVHRYQYQCCQTCSGNG